MYKNNKMFGVFVVLLIGYFGFYNSLFENKSIISSAPIFEKARILRSTILPTTVSNSSTTVFHSQENGSLPLVNSFEIECDNSLKLNGIEGKFNHTGIAIFIRHGHRTPMKLKKGNKEDNEICSITNKTNELIATNKKCISETVQVRIADYLEKMGNTCAPSQLTNLGISQHENLGIYLSKKYPALKNSNLISFSTYYTRTIISLLSLMSKLPDSCAQPTNIDASTYFCKNCTKCPALTIYKSKIPNRNFWGEPGEFSEILNFFRRNFRDRHLVSIFDKVVSSYCSKNILPKVCQTDSRRPCLSNDEYRRFLQHARKSHNRIFSDVNYKRQAFLSSFEILNNVVVNRDKNYIFSGHDVTIEAILSVFGVKLSNNVPFASRIIFEFFENNFLKIIFNGAQIFPVESKTISVEDYFTYLESQLNVLFPGAYSVEKACTIEFCSDLLYQSI